MKNPSHATTSKKKASRGRKLTPDPKAPAPLDDGLIEEDSEQEASVTSDHFEVAGREDEAASTGHRVEPIINDEEGNAQTLIEEGLHGYLHAPTKTNRNS